MFILTGLSCGSLSHDEGKMILVTGYGRSVFDQLEINAFAIRDSCKACYVPGDGAAVSLPTKLSFEILRSSRIDDAGTFVWVGQSYFLDLHSHEIESIPDEDYFQKSFISTYASDLHFIENENEVLEESSFRLFQRQSEWVLSMEGSLGRDGLHIDRGNLPLHLKNLAFIKYDGREVRQLWGAKLKSQESNEFLIIEDMGNENFRYEVAKLFPHSINWLSDSVVSYLIGGFEADYAVLKEIQIWSFNFASGQKSKLFELDVLSDSWVQETSYITHQLYKDGAMIFVDNGFFYVARNGEITRTYRLPRGYKLIAGRVW